MSESTGDLLRAWDKSLARPDNELSGPPEQSPAQLHCPLIRKIPDCADNLCHALLCPFFRLNVDRIVFYRSYGGSAIGGRGSISAAA